MAIDVALRRFVRERAQHRCEYCGLHQEELPFATFHIEHVIAKQHGGSDDASNLCLACHWCNFHKGPNLTTLVHDELVPLFNPRLQTWNDHFEISGDQIIGLTNVGKGSVKLLNMNDNERCKLRRSARNRDLTND